MANRDISVANLHEHIAEVLDSDTSQLIRNAKGDLQYDEVRTHIDQFKQLLTHFHEAGFRRLPPFRQSTLTAALTQVLVRINTMQMMVMNTSQPAESQTKPVRDFFRSAGPKDYLMSITDAWPILLETEQLARKDEPGEQRADLMERLAESVAKAEQTNSELGAVLTAAQSSQAKVGVSKHRVLFDQSANSFAGEVTSWRNWTVFLLALTGVTVMSVLGTVLWGMEGKEAVDKVEVGIFGVAIVSLLSFIVVFCIRNFFAAKHNLIVNRHKANCLGTFETFSTSADGETKSAVLLQATQMIFSHQRTGYLTKDAEMGSPSPIMEIMRRAPGSGGSD